MALRNIFSFFLSCLKKAKNRIFFQNVSFYHTKKESQHLIDVDFLNIHYKLYVRFNCVIQVSMICTTLKPFSSINYAAVFILTGKVMKLALPSKMLMGLYALPTVISKSSLSTAPTASNR